MRYNIFYYILVNVFVIISNLHPLCSNDNLHPVVYQDRLIYIDQKGNIILDDDYETKFELGQIGIDGFSKTFPIYIFPEYAYFSENKVTVKRTYGFWFIRLGDEYEVIDNTGKTVIPRTDRFVGRFSNNLAVIKIPLKSFDYIYDEKYTFVDTLGKFVFTTECDTNNKDLYYLQSINNCIKTFKFAGDYSEGWSIVFTNNNINFIDIAGNYISKLGFEDAKSFKNGFAPVKFNSKWGMINTKGDIVIQPRFEELWNFNDELARFYDGKYYGFVDRNGKIVFEDRYIYAGDFSDGYAVVKINELEYNYIDKTGKIVNILTPFNNKQNIDLKNPMLAATFREGFARVMVNGKWGFINKKLEYFIEPEYDFVSDFRDGFAYVWKDDKLMIINQQREIIWTYKFEKQ